MEAKLNWVLSKVLFHELDIVSLVFWSVSPTTSGDYHAYHHSTVWLSESQLEPHVDTFSHYLTERRYTPQNINRYIAGIAHFAHWLTQSQLPIHQINEKVALKFLDEHLPTCNCRRQIVRDRKTIRAAINHLIFVLRANVMYKRRQDKEKAQPIQLEHN